MADTTTTAAAPGHNDHLARGIYPDARAPLKPTAPNAEVQAVRDADPARKFFSDVNALGPGVVRDLSLAIAPTGTAEVLARHDVEMAGALVDLGFDRHDTAQLAALARSFRARPPTTEQRAEFHQKALTTMREKYGADFDTVLKDAKALSTRDPRLGAFFQGLGDSDWLITRMAELGRTARAKGQLR